MRLTDFVIPDTNLIPDEVRARIRKWSDYIDYWAVDWDFRHDTFMNQWQAYRTRQHRKLTLKSEAHEYPEPGRYQVLVKTGATLSQLVWDFGQAPGRWRSARASADAQRDTEVSIGLQVLLGVRTSFFTARATKDLVAVARETLANQEAHLRQIQGFVEVGVRPEIDLAQARTDRANAEVQLINAENGYATAKAQLNQAMGIEAPTDYDVSDDAFPAVEGEDLALDILLDEALGNRPDVAALASQVKAQEATLSSVRGAYWPTLGVSTGINDAGPQLSSMSGTGTRSATLTWNLFQGGLTRAQASEAQANLSGLTAQVAALQQEVRLDVDKARLAVRAARAAIGAAAEALVNAPERILPVLYGCRGLVDITTIEDVLTEA